MAFTLVGERATKNVTTAGTGTTEVVTVASGCTAGHMVWGAVACRVTAGTTLTVTDSRGNTWTVDGIANASTNFVAVFSTLQDAGTLQAGDTITLTWTAAPGNNRKIIIEEFSGQATSSRVDKTATNNVTTSTTSGNAINSGTTAATSQADELVVVAYCLDHGAGGTDTKDASYSSFTTSQIAAGSSSDGFLKTLFASYKIISSTGAQSSAITSSVTVNSYEGVIVTYKAAVAATVASTLALMGVGA